MTSTRLPRKVMLPLGRSTVLGELLERLQTVQEADCFVLATTFLGEDDEIVASLPDGVEVVRGSRSDVLARYAMAIIRFELDTVVRLTADNPMVDPSDIDRAVRLLVDQELDYVQNIRRAGYPSGFYVEVARAEVMMEAFAYTSTAAEREHVTPYLFRDGSTFRQGLLESPQPQLEHLVRLTVDTPQDYEVVSAVFADMLVSKPAGHILEYVQQLYRRNPHLFSKNSQSFQKSIRESEVS